MAEPARAPIPSHLLRSGSRAKPRRNLTGPTAGRGSADRLRLAFAGRTSTEDQQDPTLSIPRQLNNCRKVLPDGAEIVTHFYDIESGRMDLAARGRSRGHERFAIPVPRDGGIQDLLEEAERPDRRFDAVICESIDRISRRTYIGTLIENRLEQAGVLLLAADEPINLTGRRASQILTRRVKQGVAEWYVLEMLEKSWGGFEAHTEQGYNVGKPPYGYMAHRIPHPVPAKRAEGATKHVLVPDPERGPVVQHIFRLRASERLGYQVIADRLNLNLDRFPPPKPIGSHRAVGKWTASSVREIIVNPKYTGYMVWNRRATKTGGGRHNPPEAWVWSDKPTHPALVSLDIFIAAQEVAKVRERSRSAAGANSAHPSTRRVYRLRSFLTCAMCGRRMFGKTRRDHAFYACAPDPQHIPEGHPKSIWISEAPLIDGVAEFFATNIFGPHRRARLNNLLLEADNQAARDHQEKISAVRRTIDDLDARQRRLVHSLELTDDPPAALIRNIKTRSQELTTDREAKQAELAELEAALPPRHSPELLDALPAGPVDISLLPDEITRKLFDVFRLEVSFDKRTRIAHCRVTLAGTTIEDQARVAHEVMSASARTHTARAGGRAGGSYQCGAPGRIRTCGTRFRSQHRTRRRSRALPAFMHYTHQHLARFGQALGSQAP
ncbi:recombinase family protein [Actinomadura rupiterrae]|uniref:recombinase family protein n=1 Tax=Actinomadura rupiterrae TaxID=559627 RepID=UPI0020A36D00|nr:recombinase family protein [Actinomadura rupiterrae]